MEFFLQQWEKNGRLIIDTGFPASAHRVIESRQAPCWLEAKKLFGFELTPVQDWLLTEFYEKEKG